MIENLIIIFLINLLVVSILFSISLVIKKADIIDIYWGPSFSLSCLILLLINKNYSFPHLILIGLVAFWSLRLGSYLYTRWQCWASEAKSYLWRIPGMPRWLAWSRRAMTRVSLRSKICLTTIRKLWKVRTARRCSRRRSILTTTCCSCLSTILSRTQLTQPNRSRLPASRSSACCVKRQNCMWSFIRSKASATRACSRRGRTIEQIYLVRCVRVCHPPSSLPQSRRKCWLP